MRNVWKGMILGALAGAGVGLGVDAMEAMGREGRQLGHRASTATRDLAAEGRSALSDANVGEKVSALGDKAKELVDHASPGA